MSRTSRADPASFFGHFQRIRCSDADSSRRDDLWGIGTSGFHHRFGQLLQTLCSFLHRSLNFGFGRW